MNTPRPSSSGHALAAPLALLVLGMAALGVGVATLGSPDSTRADGTPVVRQGEDAVALFGPQRFEATRGRPALHVEQFNVELRPGRRYSVSVENGDAGGPIVWPGPPSG